MKRVFTLLSIFAVALVGVMATPDESSAIPAYARQTGNACYACHFQFIPKLNAMGRAFKLSGYTDASASLIEDDNLSINEVMPISMIVKLRYILTTTSGTTGDDKGSDRGELEIPDEIAFLLGGRISENFGAFVEWAGMLAKGDFIFSFPIGDNRAGLSIFTTDGSGPFVFDLFNTGVHNSIRMFESKNEYSVAAKAGLGTNATGIGLFAGGEMFFVNAGLWGPADKPSGFTIDTGLNLSLFYRVAAIIPAGDFEIMIGAAGTAGETKCVDCLGATVEQTLKTEALVADLQIQGEVGGMTLEIQGEYANVGGDASTDANVHRTYTKGNGFSAGASLGVTPVLGVKLGYVNYTDTSGASDVDTTSFVVGGWYDLAQNVVLVPEYSTYSGDGKAHDSKVLVMLEFAF